MPYQHSEHLHGIMEDDGAYRDSGSETENVKDEREETAGKGRPDSPFPKASPSCQSSHNRRFFGASVGALCSTMNPTVRRNPTGLKDHHRFR